MFTKYFKSPPKDCIICAGTPGLFLNRFNVHHASYSCFHSVPPTYPRFRPSLSYKLINALISAMLAFGIANDFGIINGNFTAQYLLVYIEILYCASIIFYNTNLMVLSTAKIREYHGLISIIANKTSFGVDTVLTAKSCQDTKNLLLIFLACVLAEELVTLVWIFWSEPFQFRNFLRVLSIELVCWSNVSLSAFFFHYMSIYRAVFEHCFEEIQTCFIHENCIKCIVLNDGKGGLGFRLAKLQRMYLSLQRNFKFIEDCVPTAQIVISCADMCILLIALTYYVIMVKFMAQIEVISFDIFLTGKMLSLATLFGVHCFQIQYIADMGNDILSFLYKVPTSGLSPMESAQVEMLIYVISMQRPIIKTSDLFTLGTKLVASISSTVLTYLLVALQFNRLWSN